MAQIKKASNLEMNLRYSYYRELSEINTALKQEKFEESRTRGLGVHRANNSNLVQFHNSPEEIKLIWANETGLLSESD